uniref:Integrase, catalytic region, zinc finger, CCHC-type, peptidase aspartic, catalytic n=1 Tax=Tanacetum cinerariifolium TaxID=118510 RepID=A0A6L2JK51_TANCI|nr:hypothetical protein [Tanacetum cinerariifolium]
MAKSIVDVGAENRPPMLEKVCMIVRKLVYGFTFKGRKMPRYLNLEEKLRKSCDIKATNIILLGLPVDIYTLVNHYQTTKEIWEWVKELMEDTKLTLQEHELKLYDDFDRFASEKRESIHSYYWRYSKLINDMNIIGMTMTKIQVNTSSSIISRFPPTNNQLRTSLNLRIQATIQDGRVTVQNIQGRHSQGYAINTEKSQANQHYWRCKGKPTNDNQRGLVVVGFDVDGVKVVDELVGGGGRWCSGGVGENEMRCGNEMRCVFLG